MNFSSIPAYLDPANWQQQPIHQIGANNTNPGGGGAPAPPPPPPAQPHAGGGGGGIRPGSMAERARIANIPMPEGPLKCPRCESANTKFCYFNNYSLSQPRHFCKTCRRYWTRGGALRTVPVGGGCRRNKRSKSTRSKSPVSGDRQTSSSTSTSTVSSKSGPPSMAAFLTPQLPPLRFMSPLGQLSHDHYNSGDVSLSYNGVNSAPPLMGTSEMNFHTNFLGGGGLSGGLGGSGGGGGGGIGSLLSSGGIEQWRLHQQAQQFHFLSGLDSSPGLYQFPGGVDQSGFVGETSQVRPKISTSMLTQLASMKMEEHPELQLSRQLLGIPTGNDHHQQWNNNNAWTDLSSFSSSSTSNAL